MSDPKIPSAPLLPTLPWARSESSGTPQPTTAGDVVLEIAELKLILEQTMRAISAFDTRVSRYQLELMGGVHRVDVAIDINRETRKVVDNHEARLAALEAAE